MKDVKSLAHISGEQTTLAEIISICVRLCASLIVLVVSLAAGRWTAAIATAGAFLALVVMSMIIVIRLRSGKGTEKMYIASIVIDSVAALVMSTFTVATASAPQSLTILVVLYAYFISITMLASLRLVIRDVLAATGCAILNPVFLYIISLIWFSEAVAKATLAVPLLSLLIGGISTLTCFCNRKALEENLITEDLLKASRRLKMTMDIVSASIFNLHQLLNKLSDVSTTVSGGARNQEAGIEQVTMGAEQLQKSMESISTTTEKSATTIGRTAQYSDSGNTIMKKVIGEIVGIHGVVDKMVDALARINDIADQTNLLALNAAIEASRAGDEQSGFSVVADEIRQLAEKSSETAGEVSKSVKQIEVVITSGGESTREAGKIFDTIARDLGTYAGFIHDLSRSVKEQLDANREVTRAIESIGSVVEDNRIMAETVTKITGDLKKEMLKLESLVGNKTQEAEKLYQTAERKV